MTEKRKLVTHYTISPNHFSLNIYVCDGFIKTEIDKCNRYKGHSWNGNINLICIQSTFVYNINLLTKAKPICIMILTEILFYKWNEHCERTVFYEHNFILRLIT